MIYFSYDSHKVYVITLCKQRRAIAVKKNENKKKKKLQTNCESCSNYVYEEDYDCYICLVNLDEDEMYRFLSGNKWECPYFRRDDEYGVVRHQI